MKIFIGVKIITAEPMDLIDFEAKYRDKTMREAGQKNTAGYHVVYANTDGPYHSWSPKDVFELAYREVSNEDVLSIINTNKNVTNK